MALPRIEAVITADTKQAEAGFDRVERGLHGVGDAAVTAGNRSNQFSRRLSRNVSSSRRFQMGVQNASYQLNDFAMQVGAGTSASIALGQQLPQLLQGFGVLGAVLSVAVAAGVPLTRMFMQMSEEGRDLSIVLGTLQPVAVALGAAFKQVADFGVIMAEAIINNLDRILITAGLVAGFFVGKWVVAFVAARVATFSLVGALAALRTALIRIGLGALIVAAGEVAYQFSRITSAAGGIGAALGLVGDIFKEVWGRLKIGAILLGEMMDGVAMQIQGAFMTAFGVVDQEWIDLVNSVLSGINSISAGLNNVFGTSFGMSEMLPDSTMGEEGSNISALGRDLTSSAATALSGALSGPLESVTRIRDLLASMKEEGLTLPDILGTGAGEEGGEGETGQEKLDRELTAQEERVAEHFNRITALTQGGLSDKLGAWGSYFGNLASLTGSNNKKLLGLQKSFAAAQALIDAWGAHNKVLNDPTLPWWARIASAAQVFAAGVGAVNAIRSVSDSGSGTGGAVASGGAAVGGAATQPEPARPQTTLTFVGEYFSGEMIAGALNEYAQSGGRLDGDLIVRRA